MPQSKPAEGEERADLYQEMWKKKSEEAMEEEFQKQLRVQNAVFHTCIRGLNSPT